MNVVSVLLLLVLLLNGVNGRWNIGHLLSTRKKNMNVEQVKPWHQRLFRKSKRHRHKLTVVMETNRHESWRLKLSKSLKRLIQRTKVNALNEKSLENKSRLLKRQTHQFIVRKERPKQTRKHHYNETTSLTIADCSSFKQTRSIWKRHKDAITADTAYRMAILSSLAYWEFHKRPAHTTSFCLQSDKHFKRTSLGQSAKVALCHIVSGVSNNNIIVEQHHGNINRQQQSPSCRQVVQRSTQSGRQHDFQWYLHDWHEPTPLAGKWHDTDLLVTTSGDDMLVLSFAGTASAADAVTNVQTFEKVGHSGIFNITGGSIHRGFFNAYSRVERGHVTRVCRGTSCDHLYNNLTSSLYQRYQHCDFDTSTESKVDNNNKEDNNITVKEKKTKRQKCRGRDEKLMLILRDLVTTALLAGHKVHLAGHSLGGGLATLLALDVILNFPLVPVSKLHLWTFGAPEVADDVFLQSAMEASPRLKAYIQNRGRRYHRYVTLSDKCKADVVSTIASKTLPSHKQGLHGRIARRLGGVRGWVIHIAEPHYLPPLRTANGTAVDEDEPPTKTGSTFGAHHITSYLQGIARESPSHPLMSNLPFEVAQFVGEVPPQKATKVPAGVVL